MYRASIERLGAINNYRYGLESYNPSGLGLGSLMIQSTGVDPEDNWAGPIPIDLGRPFEASQAIAVAYPWAMRYTTGTSSQIDWVFLAENSTAAATRRIVAYTYNRLNNLFDWRGYITVSFPTQTAHTIRAFRMTYDVFNSGTVYASGVRVSGAGTTWSNDYIPTGCRIGFGSNVPQNINTWYDITGIYNNTGIILASSITGAGIVPLNSPYVIEDLRAVICTTNATAINGGVYLVKGISMDSFSPIGTNVTSGTSFDSTRACYWLKSTTGTITEQTVNGCGLEDAINPTGQTLWIGNGTTTQRLYKFNIRAPLTVITGGSVSAYQLATNTSAALVGTATQTNNGRVANTQHGPGSGVTCYYFTTSTRLYRTKALSSISDGDTTFISAGDAMPEIPPGSANTLAATSALNSVEYSSVLDTFLVNIGANPGRTYMTQYRTDSSQMDRAFLGNLSQLNQAATDSSTTILPSNLSLACSSWIEGGLCYLVTNGTAATNNFIYVIPLGADWEYITRTGSRLILPKIRTQDAARYISTVIQNTDILGGTTGYNLGSQTEPIKVYYRTSGIDDDSGSWTLLDQTGYMNVVGAEYIQFSILFRVIGLTCIPSRIHTVGVIWEDNGTDEHWQFSAGIGTDLVNKRFGFRHAVAYGGTVPELEINIYDADSGALLVTDNSTDQANGDWHKSTDNGGAWGAYDSNDKGNNNTYIRFTPDSISDNIKVKATLRHSE